MSKNSWNQGYVTDLNYTSGYYTELNPERLRFGLLLAGVRPPTINAACELGFGNGISISIHSAASKTSWYGNDFNPAQVINAKSLMKADQAENLYDDSFEEFLNRQELPSFDYIGLHGIWTWVSESNWQIIVKFIKQKLNPGGIVYISYNATPGWNSFAPVRDLMLDFGDSAESFSKSIEDKFKFSVDLIQRLESVNARYLQINKSVVDRISKFKDQDPAYLIHEYFNRNWRPTRFKEMVAYLEPAKLSYATSAHLLDLVDEINLTKNQADLLKEIKDPALKESVRDFIICQSFRRDIWIKGATKLPAAEREKLLYQTKFILSAPIGHFKFKVTGMRGEASLDEKVYKAILSRMESYDPITFENLKSDLVPQQMNANQLLQAITVLYGTGEISSVSERYQDKSVIESSQALNLLMMHKNLSSYLFQYLASPITGGGVRVDKIHQVFLLNVRSLSEKAEHLVVFAKQYLDGLGQKLVIDGEVIRDNAKEQQELLRIANEFLEKHLKMYTSLKLISIKK